MVNNQSLCKLLLIDLCKTGKINTTTKARPIQATPPNLSGIDLKIA
jgi:hypothetical protein